MFNKSNTKWFLVCSVLCMGLYFNTVWAEADLKGSKDHSKIPRLADTIIIGYAKSNYDEGVFMSGTTGNKMETEKIEGKRTRIMYVGPEELSPLGALRNYQNTFADLGEVEEVYTCKGNDCFTNLGQMFIWNESNRLPTDFGFSSKFIYHQTYYYKNQIYWYAKVKTPESIFHVSVYSAIRTEQDSDDLERLNNKPLIHLEVVEVKTSVTEAVKKAEHPETSVQKAESLSARFPYGYKDWTNTFAKVVEEKGPFYGFLRVLVSSQALDSYQNGSKGYENGDVLILEFNEIENEDDGTVKGEVNWIAVMEKDSSATETGGWEFSAFDGKTKKLKTEINPVSDCYICHKAVTHRDYVFSESK